jgi:hypothetical protein
VPKQLKKQLFKFGNYFLNKVDFNPGSMKNYISIFTNKNFDQYKMFNGSLIKGQP